MSNRLVDFHSMFTADTVSSHVDSSLPELRVQETILTPRVGNYVELKDFRNF